MLWLGQISKTSDNIILSSVSINNQPVSQTIRGTDNCKFTLNNLEITLVSGQVCSKALPLGFGHDYASWDQKKLMNEYPMNGIN